MVHSPDQTAIPILVVSEYLSDKDENGIPLTSPAGHVFRKWMRQAGINLRQCEFTSVLTSGATLNQALVPDKSLGIPGIRHVRKTRNRNMYLARKHEPELNALWAQINRLRPNVILALGDLGLWATTAEVSLKNARGRITEAKSNLACAKVLPTYSPMQVMSDYPLRPILLADLSKCLRESEFPEIRRPCRFIHIEPDLNDLRDFYAEYIAPADELSVDIETKGRIITCVGFAPSPERALVVPFFREERMFQGSYWPTPQEELIAWAFVRRVLREKASFGQNFQYDMQYLWREAGIKCRRFCDDTMLLHHALQIEMQKGLGFLASVYTDELAWKFMRQTMRNDKSAKRGDLE